MRLCFTSYIARTTSLTHRHFRIYLKYAHKGKLTYDTLHCWLSKSQLSLLGVDVDQHSPSCLLTVKWLNGNILSLLLPHGRVSYSQDFFPSKMTLPIPSYMYSQECWTVLLLYQHKCRQAQRLRFTNMWQACHLRNGEDEINRILSHSESQYLPFWHQWWFSFLRLLTE